MKNDNAVGFHTLCSWKALVSNILDQVWNRSAALLPNEHRLMNCYILNGIKIVHLGPTPMTVTLNLLCLWVQLCDHLRFCCSDKIYHINGKWSACGVVLFLPTALYNIHKKKVYGAKMLESQNLQSPKSKYVPTHEHTRTGNGLIWYLSVLVNTWNSV